MVNTINIKVFAGSLFFLAYSLTASAENLIEYKISDSEIIWTIESSTGNQFRIRNYSYESEFERFSFAYDSLDKDEIWWDIFDHTKRLLYREARKSREHRADGLIYSYKLDYPVGKIRLDPFDVEKVQINNERYKPLWVWTEINYTNIKHVLEKIYAEAPILFKVTYRGKYWLETEEETYTYFLNTKGLKEIIESEKERSEIAIKNYQKEAKELIEKVKTKALILTILSFTGIVFLLVVAYFLLKRLARVFKPVVSYLVDVMKGFKNLIIAKSQKSSGSRSTLNISNNATEIMDWLDLKNKGVITEEEFEAKKKELLR